MQVGMHTHTCLTRRKYIKTDYFIFSSLSFSVFSQIGITYVQENVVYKENFCKAFF